MSNKFDWMFWGMFVVCLASGGWNFYLLNEAGKDKLTIMYLQAAYEDCVTQ